MGRTPLAAVAVAGLVAGWTSVAASGTAQADPEALNPNAFDLSALDRAVAPMHHALELAVAGGYTQGVGGAGDMGAVQDVSGPGGNVEVQLGVRMSPTFSLGVYGTLARYQHGDALTDGNQAHGATAGVQALWHARPDRSVDPWISIGTGWRGLWLTSPNVPSSTAYGLELARAQLGLDFRVSPGFALAPVVGASASVFLAEDTAMTTELTAIHDNRLNLYVFTGLLGRFDLGR
ncbi:MAG TPA: hypothetical protein VH165_28255 [Kofleriaceae bacterium]|nr:hypothetical protein [Kofleriaceae bacterium]